MLKTVEKINFSEIDATRKRFLILNRERLRRAEGAMRATQRDFLDFLPLLFHLNHPSLPGYVSKDTPCGICDYAPTKRVLMTAKKHVKHFEYKKRALPRYDVVSMFLMGSSGTVAYSRRSDFDIWLCHQHDTTTDKLAELQAKASAIEAWADEQGLEVHFFLMDPESFKQGEIVDLSSESSGSAQYYLLLEEFYRTSLLLAGRYPVWWLVPAEEESNYDEYVSGLLKRRLITEAECVDFGGIPDIPTKEFFGAALWQLFKGIDSPYKSILKLLLMEVYASQYPKIELLCLRFKRAIYGGEIELNRLDPYLMLYRQLEEHIIASGEESRLELVRRCFYFKVGQRLSTPDSKVEDWRRDVMRSLVGSWGWDQEDLETLDERASWKIVQVMKERAVLVKEFKHTYRFLSSFARKHAQLLAINQQDLNALGHKLFIAFERKPGKVEVVNRGISQNVWESSLTFYRINTGGGSDGWALFLGKEDVIDLEVAPLKRSHNLIELLAWSYFNGLADGRTRMHIGHDDNRQREQEMSDVVRGVEKVMPRAEVMVADAEELGQAVKILQSTIIINLGSDPLVRYAKKDNYLASNRTDAFSYGGMHESLVRSIDQIIVSSWKEVITAHYEGIEGIFNCLGSYLKWMKPSAGTMPSIPTILCYSTSHSVTIKQRIEQLFSNVFNCFYRNSNGLAVRYVLDIENMYYMLYLEGGTLHYERLMSKRELFHYLAKGRSQFSEVVIDHNALTNTWLPLIYKLNKPGVVQLFYREKGERVDVYVLDENGSLSHQKLEFFDSDSLLAHFSGFFNTVLNRYSYQLSLPVGNGSSGVEIEYFKLWRNHQGQRRIGRSAVEQNFKDRYFQIQVLVDQSTGGLPLFSIYCNDREFTSLEYGTEMFREVALYIIGRRSSQKRYPVFITDVDLSPSILAEYADDCVPMTEFLNHKKGIEARLNESLDDLGRGKVMPINAKIER